MKKNELLNVLAKAKNFAIESHSNQTYGTFPYLVHLYSVTSTLIKFQVLPNNDANIIILCAAWLHDILEDTKVSKEEMKLIFGDDITTIVWCVTDEFGPTRKERKSETYKKIKKNQSAIIVKLADRIANLEACILLNNIEKLVMYQSEHDSFLNELKPATTTLIGLNMFKYLETLINYESKKSKYKPIICLWINHFTVNY